MNGITLTPRQLEIVNFVRDSIEREGTAPSQREIMEHFGFRSPSTVADHLALIEKKGALVRGGPRARNLRLPHGSVSKRTSAAPRRASAGNGPRIMEIPLYGSIPAGLPSGQEQQNDRCISIDADMIQLPRNARTFALEVRGDSMIKAGIYDRDIVIMELAEPRNRDIVAALIDGETTLKRYVVNRGQPFLQAENDAYPDLIPARELVIQGVFRALVRINRARL